MMRTRLLEVLVSMLLVAGLITACTKDGDGNGDGGEGQDVVSAEDVGADPDAAPAEDLGAAEDVTEAGEDTASDGAVMELVEEVAPPEPGVGTKVVFSIHNVAGLQCLDLAEMVAKDECTGAYDVLVGKSPVGPVIQLGETTKAQNLGNTLAFDDVDEVPTEGYLSDHGEDMVIGTSWRGGGAGETGFEMTDNVYALLRGDGTYAKMMVLSAKSGNIEIVFFHQPDGSVNVATEGSL